MDSMMHADTPIQFIDIRMEDLVHETDAGGLERVLIRQFYMDFPNPTGEWG
jgi:hypothetical protein